MDRQALAQLERSHRRLDEVIEQLVGAARRLAAGRPDGGDVAEVHAAVAFFERAARRHFLDEEGSVFPRLSTRRPELADALAQLSAEHPPQIGTQTAIADLARALTGDSRPGAGKQLLELAEQLAEAHRLHEAREDELLAGAGAALTAEDDAEIVAEMAMRHERDGDGSAPREKPAKLAKPAAKKSAKPAHAPKLAKSAAAKPAAKLAKPAAKKPAKLAAAKPAAKKPAAKKPAKPPAKAKAKSKSKSKRR